MPRSTPRPAPHPVSLEQVPTADLLGEIHRRIGEQDDTLITRGEVVLSPRERSVFFRDRLYRVSKREILLLEYLAREFPGTVSFEDIQWEIWQHADSVRSARALVYTLDDRIPDLVAIHHLGKWRAIGLHGSIHPED